MHSVKPCRHFQEGKGVCPFGNMCFYSHGEFTSTVLPPSSEPHPTPQLSESHDMKPKIETNEYYNKCLGYLLNSAQIATVLFN